LAVISSGCPDHIRSENGPEFTARAIREWLRNVGAKTLYIEPGSPWENGYVESFNGVVRQRGLLPKWVVDGVRDDRLRR
jgi:transposase InsO family protein